MGVQGVAAARITRGSARHPLSAPRQITLTETIPLGVEPLGLAVEVLVIGVCTTTALALITAISVVKLWGRTRWYRGRGRRK